MSSRGHLSTSTSGNGLQECQNGSRPPRKASLDIFWHGFLISELSVQFKIAKWPLRRKFEFDIPAHINFESLHDPGPPTKSILDIYSHFFFHFCALFLPKSYQIYVFLHFLGCKTTFKTLPDEKPVRTHEMVYHKYLIRILKIRD